MKNLLIALAALVSVGCSKSGDDNPIYLTGDVLIRGEGYNFVSGEYCKDYFHLLNNDYVSFYVDLTDYAGIIIEIPNQSLGQIIDVSSSYNYYWFFSFGDGRDQWHSITNKDIVFDGWFRVELDEQTNECLLEFELSQKDELVTKGNVRGVFQQLDPTDDDVIHVRN